MRHKRSEAQRRGISNLPLAVAAPNLLAEPRMARPSLGGVLPAFSFSILPWHIFQFVSLARVPSALQQLWILFMFRQQFCDFYLRAQFVFLFIFVVLFAAVQCIYHALLEVQNDSAPFSCKKCIAAKSYF